MEIKIPDIPSDGVQHLVGKDIKLHNALTRQKKLTVPDFVDDGFGNICARCLVTGSAGEDRVIANATDGLKVIDSTNTEYFSFKGSVGSIIGANIYTASANPRITLNSTGLVVTNSGGTEIIRVKGTAGFVSGYLEAIGIQGTANALDLFSQNNNQAVRINNTNVRIQVGGGILVTISTTLFDVALDLTCQDFSCSSIFSFGDISGGNIDASGVYRMDGNEIVSSTRVWTGSGGVNTSGNITSGGGTGFSGAGGNITALNASNISTGSLSDSRLSSNVPLKNASNTFTNTFTLTSQNVNVSNGFGIANSGASFAFLGGSNEIQGFVNSTKKFVIDNTSSSAFINLWVWHNGSLKQVEVESVTGHLFVT